MYLFSRRFSFVHVLIEYQKIIKFIECMYIRSEESLLISNA